MGVIKHGMCKRGKNKTRFYRIWQLLKDRSFNKNNPAFENYGGRGINCEWGNFEQFKLDMLLSYLEHCKKFGITNTSIDRINNNGNYSKNNCRWATRKQQAFNKRSNNLISFKGKILALGQWAKELGINRTTLNSRINQLGKTYF